MLLKTEVLINITSEQNDTFDSVKKALSDACDIALKQRIRGSQHVLRNDASFRSAGYVFMIEENLDQKIQLKQKTESKNFSPAKLKLSTHSKMSLAIYMAFLQSTHISREAMKSAIVLTDKKSVTQFFQTRAIPPALWNACNHVLQFNMKLLHIAVSFNTVASFLSRLELKVMERIRLKFRENIQKAPIVVTTSSSDVAVDEQIFFTQADSEKESEQQTLQRSEQLRLDAEEWVTNAEPSKLTTSVKEFTKIDRNTTLFSMNGIKTDARIPIE